MSFNEEGLVKEMDKERFIPVNDSLEKMHVELGHKRLNPFWAKAEILLGLAVNGIGLYHIVQCAMKNDTSANLLPLVSGIILYTLGGYLAMAGSRSHLYQSNNILTAYVLKKIEESSEQVNPGGYPSGPGQ